MMGYSQTKYHKRARRGFEVLSNIQREFGGLDGGLDGLHDCNGSNGHDGIGIKRMSNNLLWFHIDRYIVKYICYE